MRNRLLFIIPFFILQAVSGKCQSDTLAFDLDIPFSTPFSDNIIKSVLIKINRSNIINGYECKVRDIKFLIGLNNNRQIIYYSTTDSNFIINNYRYLTKDKIIIDSLKKQTIIFDYKIGPYLKLPEEWNLGFSDYDIVNKNKKLKLKKTAIPKFIFKINKNFMNTSPSSVFH